MKYICLVYVEEKVLHAMPQHERLTISNESMAYCGELQKNGQLIGASPLHPVETATTVRVRGGKVSTTDGPFAETKEQLGGFLLIDVRPERRRTDRLEVSRSPVRQHRSAATQRGRLCVRNTQSQSYRESRHEIHVDRAS